MSLKYLNSLIKNHTAFLNPANNRICVPTLSQHSGGVISLLDGHLTCQSSILNGQVTMRSLNNEGVLHTDVNGVLRSEPSVSDSKLATIVTPGKVANSATTATTNKEANTIVLRDASGNINTNATSLTSLKLVNSYLPNTEHEIKIIHDTSNPLNPYPLFLSSFSGVSGIVSLVNGKVSLTAATTTNTGNTLVLRDASGNITSSTQSTNDSSTKVATTEYVQNVLSGSANDNNAFTILCSQNYDISFNTLYNLLDGSLTKSYFGNDSNNFSNSNYYKVTKEGLYVISYKANVDLLNTWDSYFNLYINDVEKLTQTGDYVPFSKTPSNSTKNSIIGSNIHYLNVNDLVTIKAKFQKPSGFVGGGTTSGTVKFAELRGYWIGNPPQI